MRATVEIPVRGITGKVLSAGAPPSCRRRSRIGLLFSLLASALLLGPEPAAAWTTGDLESWLKNQTFVPSAGITEGGPHEFIVEEAIEYLKDHGVIAPGTWFASKQFLERVTAIVILPSGWTVESGSISDGGTPVENEDGSTTIQFSALEMQVEPLALSYTAIAGDSLEEGRFTVGSSGRDWQATGFAWFARNPPRRSRR